MDRSRPTDKWLKTLLWYPLALRIGWWARKHRAAFVYVEESITFLPLLLKWASGRPVVISAADVFWDVYLGHGFLSRIARRFLTWLDRFVYRRLHGLITRTEAMKRYLLSLGVAADCVRVVPEACEPDFFYPTDRAAARRKMGFADHEVVIVHHGVLHPNKTLDKALAYLKPVFEAHRDVRLVVAGDGPLRPMLERCAADLGIASRVSFTGWLPDVRALNTILNAADISLVMRRGGFSDHFQITANLLHSLACGCAILAVRLDGIAEHVRDGVNGLLFDPDRAEEFRRQAERLIADAALREAFRREAAQTAKDNLDPARITALWVDALAAMLPGRKESA